MAREHQIVLQRDNEREHPAWCSPVHCYRTEEGVRVHVQAPACWEDGAAETRFQTGLVSPEDEPSGTTYLELALHSVFMGGGYVALSLGDARRLRDQLSAHLDAAGLGRRDRVGGVEGHLLTSSDEPPARTTPHFPDSV